MRGMTRGLSILYYLYFGFVYLLFCLLLWVPIIVLVRGKNKYNAARKIKLFWSKWMSFLIGIKTEIKFRSNPDPKLSYVICANHKSYLDIILMYLIINKDFAFLGKSEILKWPVINIFF